MAFFDDMKVSFKLGILILIALIALGIVSYTGNYYLQQASIAVETMYTDRLIPVRLLSESRANINRINSAMLELMLTTDNKKNQELKQIIDDRVAKVNNNIVEIEKHNINTQGKELLDKAKISLQKYNDDKNQIIQLALQNRNAEAYSLYTSSMEKTATIAIDDLRNCADYYAKISEQMNINNKLEVEKSSKITILTVFVSVIILCLTGLYITKIITKPLHTMVLVCKEFAIGDFRDKPRKINRKDEVGQLADALTDMRNSLRSLMKSVNESVEHLAASSEELTASADQSSQASNQVA